jgi:hypothetical protein
VDPYNSTMLLTLTTTHKPATDLGYLLHKNPAKLHSFELSFGKAHIFYPEATAERCTAALLLDVDPIGLVRGKRGQHEGGTLDQYVNDRPYVLSSFLSVAMGRAFGTAMSGRSKGGASHPRLAESLQFLRARLFRRAVKGQRHAVLRQIDGGGHKIIDRCESRFSLNIVINNPRVLEVRVAIAKRAI